MRPNIEYVNDIYGNRINENENYSGKLGYIISDDKVIYCLEPFSWIGDSYEINNDYFNNIDSEKLRYLEMIANVVEGSVKNRSIHYYMAAQELIWESITGLDTFYWSTDKNLNGSIINIDHFKNEIKGYINDFFKKPSFDSTVVKDNFFKTVVLEDTNNVLNLYEIENNSKNVVWINDNKLYITILSSDLSEIKLVRKYGSGSPTYYHNDSKQDLADLTGYVENVSTLNVQANNKYNEDLSIEFIDKKTNELINGNIDFKINENSYSTTNGIYLTNLEDNNYKISIQNVPYGYLIPKDYSFIIDENEFHKNRTITIYIDKPAARLNVIAERNYLYQIYKDDKLVNNFFTSNTFDLEVGDYYIIDYLNKKRYDISLAYKDQYTDFIEATITIPYSEEIKPNRTINKQEYNSKYYCLPNTINYKKIIKICILIILFILLIKHIYEIFKK